MYTLYNKNLKKKLIHPSVGLWYTSDLEEAREMLRACHEYVSSFQIPVEDFVIVEVETDNEVI